VFAHRREKETAMRTVIHFVGAEESVTLEEDYDKVTAEFTASEIVRFTRLIGDSRSRVTIYKSSIAYIEEAPDILEGFVA
jgi:hypothetical protein